MASYAKRTDTTISGRGERIRTPVLSLPNHRLAKRCNFLPFESCSLRWDPAVHFRLSGPLDISMRLTTSLTPPPPLAVRAPIELKKGTDLRLSRKILTIEYLWNVDD